MTNSRRGFLASLLALIPIARTANATQVFSKLSTIEIVNTASLPGAIALAPLIVTKKQFFPINTGATLKFPGVPGLAISLSALDFDTKAILPIIYTAYPAKGTVITYYLKYEVDATTGLGKTTLDTTPPVPVTT